MDKLKSFIKHEPVLAISSALAVISCFFVPPSADYLEYIDFAVLVLLFCLMAVVAGFLRCGLFDRLSAFLLCRSSGIFQVSLLMILCTFFSSMLVTNDVGLIIFVPLTLGLFSKVGQRQLILVVVLETAAANLGSMLTPIGNPQNLYLYSYYNISIGDFLKAMLPMCVASLALILLTLLIFSQKKGEIEHKSCDIPLDKSRLAVYCALFVLCILTVLHVLSFWICLPVCLATILFTDRTVFSRVDYGLLATFLMFFIFVGNIGSLPPLRTAVSQLMAGREFICSVLISQLISNVPAAIMLSGFTDRGTELLLGVNAGGLGTLVASLASLISFKYYSRSRGAQVGRYIAVFTAVNFVFLIILALGVTLI